MGVLMYCTIVQGQTDFFKDFSSVIRLGSLIPQGNLEEVLDAGPAGGLFLITPYKGNLFCYGSMTYGLLDGPQSSRTIHFVESVVGLSYALPQWWLPATGVGITHNLIRTAEKKG